MNTPHRYIMQDQVKNRVRSIMAHDIRHPDHRHETLPRPLVTVGTVLVFTFLASLLGT